MTTATTAVFAPAGSRTELRELESQIVELATRADLSMVHRLRLILVYDRSGGWVVHGATSCAVWLAQACDIERSTAREQVRVARALGELPLISEAFEAGELSYTKVRMLTREATPENEAELLDVAGGCSGEELAGELAHHLGDTLTPEEIDARQQARRSCSWRTEPDGTVTFSVRLAAWVAAQVQAVIDQQVRRVRSPKEPDGSYPTLGHQRADALVGLLMASPLTGRGPKRSTAAGADDNKPSGSSKSRVDTEVVVHVYAKEDGSWQLVTADGRPVPQCRFGEIVDGALLRALIWDDNRQPIDASHRQRHPTLRQKRVVEVRDNHQCQHPGCTARAMLEYDHKEPFHPSGDNTTVENIELLCSFHHRLKTAEGDPR